MAYSDRELLARIIKCEAGGEGENGVPSPSYHQCDSVKNYNYSFFSSFIVFNSLKYLFKSLFNVSKSSSLVISPV